MTLEEFLKRKDALQPGRKLPELAKQIKMTKALGAKPLEIHGVWGVAEQDSGWELKQGFRDSLDKVNQSKHDTSTGQHEAYQRASEDRRS